MAYEYDLRPAFTFDDILLIPEYSDVETRSTDYTSKLFDYRLKIPILSAAMDSVTDLGMMDAMFENGGIGVHHRYCDKNELISIAKHNLGGIAISPSMGVDFVVEVYNECPYTFFVLDVAHGCTKRNLEFCREIKKQGVNKLIGGNVINVQAVEQYLSIGVDHIKVGIGGGSACLTRVVTGCGFPQASAIHNIYQEFGEDVHIISDGGHNTTGDIVKALALGAEFVMLGKMLAGTEEAAMHGIYRGMASAGALSERKQEYFVEGGEFEVPVTTTVSKVLSEIKDALRTACYYLGCETLNELRSVMFTQITSNGKIENGMRK